MSLQHGINDNQGKRQDRPFHEHDCDLCGLDRFRCYGRNCRVEYANMCVTCRDYQYGDLDCYRGMDETEAADYAADQPSQQEA